MESTPDHAGLIPEPGLAIGGPADGQRLLPADCRRHWVVHLPESACESLVVGDHELGRVIYDVLRARPHWSLLAVVRGCYERRNPQQRRLRYLDLFVPPGTRAQRRLLDIGQFLPLYVMLVRFDDWATRRPDRALAGRVLRTAEETGDEDLYDLAVLYLSCLVLEDE